MNTDKIAYAQATLSLFKLLGNVVPRLKCQYLIYLIYDGLPGRKLSF